VSAYADRKRQQAVQHITELEELHEDKLEAEHDELAAAHGALSVLSSIRAASSGNAASRAISCSGPGRTRQPAAARPWRPATWSG
jgi:hypothetical protein